MFAAQCDGFLYPFEGQRIFGADIEIAFVSADSGGGNSHALQNAKGVGFHQHTIHKGAGIAFVAVANDVFFVGLCFVDGKPFQIGGESAAAAAAQAGAFDFRQYGLGITLLQALHEGGKTTVCLVFFNVQRVGVAEMFGGDVNLWIEIAVGFVRTNVQVVTHRTFAKAVIHERVEQIGRCSFKPGYQRSRAEMITQNCLGIGSLNPAVAKYTSIFGEYLDQRG